MTLEEWLNKWGTADDGEPETEWQKGYEAARDMVNIQLKCRAGETRMTLKELAEAAEAAQEKAWEANNAAWAAWQAAFDVAQDARALADRRAKVKTSVNWRQAMGDDPMGET